jgi:hypothetical protein
MLQRKRRVRSVVQTNRRVVDEGVAGPGEFRYPIIMSESQATPAVKSRAYYQTTSQPPLQLYSLLIWHFDFDF